jgi:hypothetical protein
MTSHERAGTRGDAGTRWDELQPAYDDLSASATAGRKNC